MKKIKLAAVLLATSFFASASFAEISLDSKEQVEGTWKLLQTRTIGNTTKSIERQDTWVFKNGKTTVLHIPREGIFYDQPPVDYIIEDGKLKVSILGRPSNFETFTVIEKDDKKMILKGKFDTYYDFEKK